MTSTNIYTPYTYLIGWTALNKWYYGRRTAKNCHPSEFWVSYHTSSKHVKAFRKEHGEPDVIQIRKVFDCPVKCAKWESSVLKRMNAQHNPLFLNLKNGDEKWDNTGKELSIRGTAPAKNAITFELLGRISLDDPRWKTGEIVGATKGIKNPKITGKPKGSKHSEEAKAARSKMLKGKKTHPNFKKPKRK